MSESPPAPSAAVAATIEEFSDPLPRFSFTSDRLVEYVLFAEFDYTEGSVVRAQFPRPTGIKEETLADLMMPEGAHLRESDWTIFFLKDAMLRDRQREDEERARKDKLKRENAAATAVAAQAQQSQSQTAEATSQETSTASASASNTDAGEINADTTANPQESPSSSPSTLAVVNTAPESTPLSSLPVNEGEQLCVLNFCRKKVDKRVKREALTKSLAIVTRYRFFHAFKPLIMLALNSIFDVAGVPVNAMITPEPIDDAVLRQRNGAIHSLLASLYHSLNSITIPETLRYTALNHNDPALTIQRRLYSASKLRAGQTSSSQSEMPLVTQYEGKKFPLKALPPFMDEDETLEASLSWLIARFGSGVMEIFTALLCEKRVLFLGYQQPAQDVCQAVLSSCLLVSPPLAGTLKRAFPYASLKDYSFVTVPGYIGGVTNPIFENKADAWWDVLGNVAEGKVTLAPSYAAQLVSHSGSSSLVAIDNAFYVELSHGLALKYGEEWLRCMFRDYSTHLLSMAQGKAVFFDTSVQRVQEEAQRIRVDGLKNSELFASYTARQQQLRARDIHASNGQDSDALPWPHIEDLIGHHIRTLQSKPPSTTETSLIVNDFLRYIDSESHIQHFLSLMPETQGGLLPLAMLLFHSNDDIRQMTVRMLSRIDATTEGRKFVSSLNYFVLLTYYRQSAALNSNQASSTKSH